jgi:hypothetical protein
MPYQTRLILTVMFTAVGLLAPTYRCQETSSNLTARTLFYRENPDDDQLPRVSATKPRSAKKNETSSRTAVASSASKRGNGMTEQSSASTAVIKKESRGAAEPENPGSSLIHAVQHLGLRYNLLLIDRNNNSVIEAVDPTRTFREGDCVAVELEPNRSGYLYVLEQGSSGVWKPLFPSPKLPDESNIVRSQTPIRVPQSTCFGIHSPQGMERVFVVLTRDPGNLNDLQESIRQVNSGAQSPLLAQNINQLRAEMKTRLESRDLEVETVAQPQAAGERRYAVYIANASSVASDQLSAEIQISHK